MEVIVAKTAGFCFGVNNAVNVIYKLLEKELGKKIYTLGPIIHNKQVVNELQEKGVISASRVDEIERDSIVVIRAHGVTPKVYEDLNNNGIEIIDATCLM